MNAITIRSFRVPDGDQIGVPIECGSIKFPANCHHADFFLVVPLGTIQDTSYSAYCKMLVTLDQPPTENWTVGPGSTSVGFEGAVSGHANGMEPGTVVADLSQHWDFVQNDSAGFGSPGPINGIALENYWVKPVITCLSGNPAGVLMALVGVAYDANDNALSWPLDTRGS